MKNIDKIRQIREKIKNNPKYINPMSNEFQQDIKKYGFSNGCEYTAWLRHNKILRSDESIRNEWAQERGFEDYRIYDRHLIKQKGCDNYSENKDRLAREKGFIDQRDYRDKWAKDLGYEDYNQYKNENNWNRGIYSPMSATENCSLFFGIEIGERLFERFLQENVFDYVKKTGKASLDGGIDFVCKDPIQEFTYKYPQLNLMANKEYKIQLKNRCLESRGGWAGWNMPIQYNDIADIFILCGWSDRKHLDILHIWLYHKNEVVRYKKFWRRENFVITNKQEYLLHLSNNEILELETLKNLYNELKQNY